VRLPASTRGRRPVGSHTQHTAQRRRQKFTRQPNEIQPRWREHPIGFLVINLAARLQLFIGNNAPPAGPGKKGTKALRPDRLRRNPNRERLSVPFSQNDHHHHHLHRRGGTGGRVDQRRARTGKLVAPNRLPACAIIKPDCRHFGHLALESHRYARHPNRLEEAARRQTAAASSITHRRSHD
jgi:hypothetical protein